MFTEIEKAYRRGLRERRFAAYYWPKALVIIVLAIVLVFGLGFHEAVVYSLAAVVLLGFAVYFLIADVNAVVGRRPDLTFYKKLRVYFAADDEVRLDNLVVDLYRHGLTKKEDLKLAIEYLERRRPILTRPSLLEWVLSIIVALASLVVILYDESTQMIDNAKLLSILAVTLKLALVIIAPIFLVRLFMACTDSARRKLDSILVEDLAYLYVNFDEYCEQLEELDGLDELDEIAQ